MVAVLFSDITQRTRAKEALRSSEKRFRDLFNTIRDAIIIVNERREITDCNPAFTELFGYPPEEVKGSTTRVLFENDEEYERLGREMQKQEEHRNFIYTTRYITRQGRRFIGEKNVHYLRDEEGRITGFVGLIRDITQKHRAEERINNLLQEKQMLLREVHHRIKNDMASINSLLSLQASSLENSEAARALQTAEHRINIMRNLYQTLFTNESFQRLNIGGFLETIVENLRQSYAHYSHIGLDTDFQDLEVEARLAFPAGIIVNELITNAFKYAFEGDNGGTIRARIEKRGEDRLEIQVQDNGRGLPREVAEEENYGFGLTLVDAFTRQHSGELSIERDNGTLIRSVLKIE
jgi:PAS domain S-box-containing protein